MFGFGVGDEPVPTVFYPDVNAVECFVELRRDETESGSLLHKRVGWRPNGAHQPFDIFVDADDVPTTNGQPFRDFEVGTGIFGLGPGGSMFIDDVFTYNLGSPAGATVTGLIDGAFDKEIDAFIELSVNTPLARELIEAAAIAEITLAEQAISLGGFEASSRPADALRELSEAKDLLQQALDAIDGGDTTRVGDLLIEAATSTARAELYMDGHNPMSGPLPNGLGGFDVGDPIFADRFESGDVSAWSKSTGD